jgi:hypothetical protein
MAAIVHRSCLIVAEPGALEESVALGELAVLAELAAQEASAVLGELAESAARATVGSTIRSIGAGLRTGIATRQISSVEAHAVIRSPTGRPVQGIKSDARAAICPAIAEAPARATVLRILAWAITAAGPGAITVDWGTVATREGLAGAIGQRAEPTASAAGILRAAAEIAAASEEEVVVATTDPAPGRIAAAAPQAWDRVVAVVAAAVAVADGAGDHEGRLQEHEDETNSS